MVEVVERKSKGKLVTEKLSEMSELFKKMNEHIDKGKFPEVMTAPQVMDFLQVSNQTFYNMKNAGIIRTVSIFGTKRYLRSQIMEMLLEHIE